MFREIALDVDDRRRDPEVATGEEEEVIRVHVVQLHAIFALAGKCGSMTLLEWSNLITHLHFRFNRRSPPGRFRQNFNFDNRVKRRSRSRSRGRFETRRFQRRSRSRSKSAGFNQQQAQDATGYDAYANYGNAQYAQMPMGAQYNSYDFQAAANYPPAPTFPTISCPAPPGLSADNWAPQAPMQQEESKEERLKREGEFALVC